jgi:ATP-dependent exoDNAse (exonuclease V) beta subunit
MSPPSSTSETRPSSTSNPPTICPVWSSLGGGYAGTLDLLVEDDNEQIKLVDFKSSKKPKKREWIRNYEMQAAAYSVACNERFGFFPKRAEIWISCETGEMQEFVLDRSQLMDAFTEFHGMLKDYHVKFKAPEITT